MFSIIHHTMWRRITAQFQPIHIPGGAKSLLFSCNWPIRKNLLYLFCNICCYVSPNTRCLC